MARDTKKRYEEKKAEELEAKQKARIPHINNILKTLPISDWAWPRILVYIPKERSISYADKVFDNFFQIAMQAPAPLFINYSRTDLARNKAATELLKSPFTHLLMLDIDHIHPPNIIQRLAKWVLLNPKIWVVGGLNFRRSYPHDPCCHIIDKDGKFYAPANWDNVNGLMKVDSIGTGSILIAREAFEAIKPPWFFNPYEQDKVWADKWPGEDMGFSQRCREYGVEMFVDPTLTSPHIGEYEIAEQNFRAAITNGDLDVKMVE